MITGLLLGWAGTYLVMKHWDKIVEWWADSHGDDNGFT